MRMGKKKQPVYRVVAIDQRAPRDGRYIEQIGRYDALQEPSLIEIDNERAADWLSKGAQPSETVEKLLNISGAMNTMKIQSGGIHVVGVEKAPVEEAAPVVDEVDEIASDAAAKIESTVDGDVENTPEASTEEE